MSKRAPDICTYCGKPKRLTRDHVFPKRKLAPVKGESMTTAPRNKRLVVGMMVALAVVIFVFDTQTPLGWSPAPLFRPGPSGPRCRTVG